MPDTHTETGESVTKTATLVLKFEANYEKIAGVGWKGHRTARVGKPVRPQ